MGPTLRLFLLGNRGRSGLVGAAAGGEGIARRAVAGCSCAGRWYPSRADHVPGARGTRRLRPFNRESGKEAVAVAAAQAWLGKVDQGEYAESWEQAARYFKDAVSKGQWEQSLQAVRPPLGGLISRQVKGSTYTTALPGAPDGEYVVIQFETSFEHKRSAVETVTPMRDEDGQWRVSGYFIR